MLKTLLDSLHRNLVNGNCPWLGEAGNSNEYNVITSKRTVRIFSVSLQSRSLFSASFQNFCLTARAYLKNGKKRLVSFQIQREVLESHLEGEIRYHLHLSCCKLNDTKDEVRNLQLEVGERAQAVQNQFEERVQALQNHFEDRLHALQNRFEERVQALENHFEERVNLLTVTSDKMRKNLQNRFEERVQALQNHFEERVNLLTVTGDKMRKNLQNRFEERVQALQNRFEERANLLTVTGDKLRKNLSFTRIICAVAVVILATLSGMSNYESASSDLKTEMEGRVTDVRTQLEGKLDEAHKQLKEKVS